MYHQASAGAVEVEWAFVSIKRPCAICGGHHGCRRGFGDEFACCTQVLSQWPLTAGGWVHRVRVQVDAVSQRAPNDEHGS